ncbi:MAG: hypothetical protein NZ578_05070 [Candidatus Binatia bacterium]|nr:hypothetical protein [Candidatus Binatia bacterium]MDW8252345.1 hypothetical protein [Chloroflexota bacterium]
MSRYSMHINHNLTIQRLLTIIKALQEGMCDIESLAYVLGTTSTVVDRLFLPELKWMGLVSREGLNLTQTGEQLANLSDRYPSLVAECIHFIIFDMKLKDQPSKEWAYQFLIHTIWTEGSEKISLDKSDLATSVVNAASSAFNLQPQRIAFSKDSVQAIFNYLAEFHPRVLSRKGKGFIYQNRNFCSELSTLWAISHLYKVESIERGMRIFLTESRRRELCKLLLLEEGALNFILRNLKSTTDYESGGLFDFSDRGGFGEWVLLRDLFPAPKVPE